MITTLKKHGNSQALIINRTMLEGLGLEDDAQVQVTMTNGSLVITPANVGIEDDELRGMTRKIRKRYGPMLKRLAE